MINSTYETFISNFNEPYLDLNKNDQAFMILTTFFFL